MRLEKESGMSVTTENIRNIALCGHGSTGKTTLTETILFNGGAIPKPESVETGKTVSDTSEEEISRKISIHSSLSYIMWNGYKINILDTPGVSDFVGEVVSALRAAELAVILVGADVGVQIETVKLWRRLNKTSFPRVVFINKMGKEHADFKKALDDLKAKFTASFVPLTIPIGKGNAFQGVINLIEMKAYLKSEGKKPAPSDIPEELKAEAEKYHEAMVETAAEGDDKLIEKFFEQGSLSEEEIQKGLAKGIKNGKIVPVLCGSALDNKGVFSLLDVIVHVGPSPEGETTAADAKGNEITRAVKSSEPFSAFVFKTSIDQFSGKLSYIKVLSGSLKPDSEVINSRDEHKEKNSKIYTCIGKKLVETQELTAGDIGVLTKMNSVATNDTVCSADSLIRFKSLDLPQPVHAVAISATTKKDEDKLNQLLLRTAEEDLTFVLTYNKETKETVVSSMGELHLSIILDRIKEKQKIEMETHVPKIAYRETLQSKSGAEYTHKKQTGGHGQYAKVVLEIAPLARGEQFKFVNAIFGGSIPKGYIPGVEKGVIEGMEHGILAGYPVVDLEAKVIDGKEHPVDSSEMAFKLASRGALRAALEKANPVLLEPVMNLSVFVDDAYLGDILSDISSRRGRVLGQEPIGGGIQEVKAQVPQSELLRYSIDLKSITSGTASFEMEFSHYSPITGKIADEVIKAAQALHKEEAEK
jgi:elongation factor G